VTSNVEVQYSWGKYCALGVVLVVLGIIIFIGFDTWSIWTGAAVVIIGGIFIAVSMLRRKLPVLLFDDRGVTYFPSSIVRFVKTGPSPWDDITNIYGKVTPGGRHADHYVNFDVHDIADYVSKKRLKRIDKKGDKKSERSRAISMWNLERDTVISVNMKKVLPGEEELLKLCSAVWTENTGHTNRKKK
jgi:hypothetical protein